MFCSFIVDEIVYFSFKKIFKIGKGKKWGIHNLVITGYNLLYIIILLFFFITIIYSMRSQ